MRLHIWTIVLNFMHQRADRSAGACRGEHATACAAGL